MAASEFATFLNYRIYEQADPDELVVAARALARMTGASVYDALYISYAEVIHFDVVTTDEQLARQMASHAVRVHLLSELDIS